MKAKSSSFVQRLWALCHVLRDDGITYHQYVEEIALLLFSEDGQTDRRRGPAPPRRPLGRSFVHRGRGAAAVLPPAAASSSFPRRGGWR